MNRVLITFLYVLELFLDLIRSDMFVLHELSAQFRLYFSQLIFTMSLPTPKTAAASEFLFQQSNLNSMRQGEETVQMTVQVREVIDISVTPRAILFDSNF